MIPNDIFTLANIYKYTSDEELETIVHSIIGRLWEQKDGRFSMKMLLADLENEDRRVIIYKPTDQELATLAKGLRTPK